MHPHLRGLAMRSSDELVSFRLASAVAEVAGAFQISVSRAPADGKTNEASFGKVRALRVHLEFETEGRGDRDSREYESVTIPIDRFGMGQADVNLEVPFNAPVSYDGRMIRIKYQLVITTDRQSALDHRLEIPVVVAPAGGASTYQYPHPLPSQ